MTRTRTVVVGVLLTAVLLALWAAVYLSLRARPVADAPSACATVSAADQRSLQWLMQLRQDDGIPLVEIALPPCDSGTRSGATAFVEIGRSALVQEFFTTRHDCDVRQSCSIATEAGTFSVRLSFAADDGWQLSVRPQEAL
jgi:hypothetical protein